VFSDAREFTFTVDNPEFAVATEKQSIQGKAEFNAANDDDYNLDGKVVGRIRGAKGFYFMQAYDAGHLMPMDKPDVALDMVNKFFSKTLHEAVSTVV